MTIQIFVGATSAGFQITGTTSGAPGFRASDGTRSDAPATQMLAPTDEPKGLTKWLASPEAKGYEGRWVLLDDDLNVVDYDVSPSALLTRNNAIMTPTIVFVQPAAEQIAV